MVFLTVRKARLSQARRKPVLQTGYFDYSGPQAIVTAFALKHVEVAKTRLAETPEVKKTTRCKSTRRGEHAVG